MKCLRQRELTVLLKISALTGIAFIIKKQVRFNIPDHCGSSSAYNLQKAVRGNVFVLPSGFCARSPK